MKASYFLFTMGLLLLTGSPPVNAQSFENLFLQNGYNSGVPQFLADVNEDGKLEYLYPGHAQYYQDDKLVPAMPCQWRTIDGNTAVVISNQHAVDTWSWQMRWLNADALPGFATYFRAYQSSPGQMFIPINGSYQYITTNMDGATGVTWADVNLDGLLDMLYWQKIDGTYRPLFKFQQADGSFLANPVKLVTDEAELQNAQYASGGNGAFSVNLNSSFSGFSGADKYYSKNPLTVVDLNMDGYPDFLDSKGGMSMLSLGYGRYYMANFSGKVLSADVNGDGLTDLLVYNAGALTLKLNNGNGFTDTQLLMNNALNGLYVLDCDGDSQPDILATLATNDASYLAFFRNQGNGKFKKIIRSVKGYVNWSPPYYINNNGRPTLFSNTRSNYGDPEDYWTNTAHTYGEQQVTQWDWDADFKIDTLTVNPDSDMLLFFPPYDVDGDGKAELVAYRNEQWADGTKLREKQWGVWHLPVTKANTAPRQMAAPNLILDKSTALLRAEWLAGSDAENAPADLTYELEISAAGKKLLRRFTKERFALAAAGLWHEPTVEARVRAIDASGMKGAWSEKATVSGIPQTADFTVSTRTCSTADTVWVEALNGMQLQLRGLPEGEVVKTANNRQGIVFSTHGTKQIEVTCNGSISTLQQVEVLPLLITDSSKDMTDPFGSPMAINGQLFDYLQQGTMQVMNHQGFFAYTNGHYEKQPVFGLSDGASKGRFVFDANMDGLPDVYCDHYDQSGNGSYQSIVNQGDGEFEKNTTMYTFDGVQSNSISLTEPVDINNDGLLDMHTGEKFYINQGDGTFKSIQLKLGDYYLNWLVSDLTADYDRDGRIDLVAKVKKPNGKDVYAVLFNEGNEQFTVVPLPDNFNIIDKNMAFDTDGDGYLDLVSNYHKCIVRNLGNRTFAQVEALGKYVIPIDLDLDGKDDYQSIKADELTFSNYGQQITFSNESKVGIWGQSSSWTPAAFADANADGVPDYENLGLFLLKRNNPNTAPTAPTTVMVNQKGGEVVISWDGATDRESATPLLSYNISIREKGASGDSSYIWSPLNATSNKAKMAQTRVYTTFRQSTTLPMPASRFKYGSTYEISVQTIDPWLAASAFSAPVSFTPQAVTLISLPAKAGVGQPVRYKVESTLTSGVALRTDGGTLNANGTITWNTPGLKQVTAIVNDGEPVVSKASILIVDKPDLSVKLPATMLAGQTITFALPECARNNGAQLQLTANGELQTNLNAGTATLTLPDDATSCKLNISYTDEVWTDKLTTNTTIHVVGQQWQPQIDKVTSVNNHNVITWNAGQTLPDASLFTGKVKLYREGSVTDEYECIGEANLSDGSFTDTSSSSDVKSSRYLITLPTVYGIESAPSQVHASVHLMVNRGIGNDINLRWSGYEGARVSQYIVYAGSSPDNLSEVERLSGNACSYVHHRTSTGVTYYAIGFNVTASSQKRVQRASKAAMPASNVISSAEAYGVIPVTALEIATTEADATFSETQTTLHLKALVTPVWATISTVEWSIVDGETLATVDSRGTLQVLSGTTGGTVTVQAKATDGSGIVATRSFEVPVKAGIDKQQLSAPAIRLANGKIMITGIHSPTSLLVTTIDGKVLQSAKITANRTLNLAPGIYIIRLGSMVKKVSVF